MAVNHPLPDIDDTGSTVVPKDVVRGEVTVNEVGFLPRNGEEFQQIIVHDLRFVNGHVPKFGRWRGGRANVIHHEDVLVDAVCPGDVQSPASQAREISVLFSHPNLHQISMLTAQAGEPGVALDVLNEVLEHGI